MTNVNADDVNFFCVFVLSSDLCDSDGFRMGLHGDGGWQRVL